MRGREPEGMWNLLSIVREMYRRRDSNAIPLLEILTDEILSMEQVRAPTSVCIVCNHRRTTSAGRELTIMLALWRPDVTGIPGAETLRLDVHFFSIFSQY